MIEEGLTSLSSVSHIYGLKITGIGIRHKLNHTNKSIKLPLIRIPYIPSASDKIKLTCINVYLLLGKTHVCDLYRALLSLK